MTRRKQPLKRPERQPEILLDTGFEDDRIPIILELAKDRGWRIKLLSLLRRFPETPPDGALVRVLPKDPLATRLREINCPAVRLGQFPNTEDHLLPAVIPDLRSAGRLAAEHFASRQYKGVAFVGYASHHPGTNFFPMFDAFRSRSRGLGMTCHYHSTKNVMVAKSSKLRQAQKDEGYRKLVAGLPKPVGVFTFSDGSARRICDACHDVGVNVPEDVSILGYGNTLSCDLTDVPMSSIDMNVEGHCRQAVELLTGLMVGASPPECPVMVPPAKVVERTSTDVLSAADPMVRRALRFMWDHLDQDLAVEDVAREVGASASTLKRKLRKEIGRGISAELRRKRVERVCELLRNTEMSVTEIAALTGFRSKGYLHRVFRTDLGVTPIAYRQEHGSG